MYDPACDKFYNYKCQVMYQSGKVAERSKVSPLVYRQTWSFELTNQQALDSYDSPIKPSAR